MPESYQFGPRAIKQVAETIRKVGGTLRNPDGRPLPRYSVNQVEVVQGFLLENLEAADDPYTGQKTARLQAYYVNSDEELVDANYELNVINRFTDFSASEGDFLVAQHMGAEWAPQTRGGGSQIIRFELTGDISCELCQARAVVLSRPPGVSRVYGEDEYGEITVWDFLNGELLSQPYDDLYNASTGQGMRGFASLQEWDHEECAADPNESLHWEIHSLWPASECST